MTELCRIFQMSHLPPVAVIEWLLAQDWAEPIPTIEVDFPNGNPNGLSHSSRYDYHEVRVPIGPDETAIIQMPDSALQMLQSFKQVKVK